MIRVGIVGCGQVADKHLGFISKMGNAEVVALADTVEDNARKLGEKYGVRNVYTSLEDMIKSEKIDVLHILTPPKYHYPNAVLAINNNINVLIEKPMVLHAKEAYDIYKLADEKGVSVCVDFIQLFNPCTQEAIKLVESGKYGRVIHIESRWSIWEDVNLPELREPSRMHWIYELPGGMLQNFISHPLYLVLYWLGKPRKISATPRALGVLPQGVTDHLDITIEGSEINANITISSAVRPRLYYLRLFCERGIILVNFDTMTVVVDSDLPLPGSIRKAVYNFSQAYQLTSGTVSNFVNHIRKKLVPYHGLKNLINDYYESLKNNVPPPISRDLVLAVSEAEEVVLSQAGKVRFDHTPRPSKQKGVVNGHKVLVTGASGFVGSELIKHLVDRGYYVRALVRGLSNTEHLEDAGVEIIYGDVRDSESLSSAANGVDTIVHLAAGMKGTRQYIYDTCVEGTKNVADIAVKRGVKRVIYMSSQSVYDFGVVKNGSTISEDSLLERNPELRGAYSLGKREAEKIALSNLDHENPSWTILRPSMIFGYGNNMLSPQVGLKLGKVLVVFGSREKKLHFIHVGDVCRAVVDTIENDNTRGKVYNLSHYDTISIHEYIDNYIKKKYGNLRVIYLPYPIAYSSAFLFEMLGKMVNKDLRLSRYRLPSLQRDIIVDSRAFCDTTNWRPVEELREQLSKEI